MLVELGIQLVSHSLPIALPPALPLLCPCQVVVRVDGARRVAGDFIDRERGE